MLKYKALIIGCGNIGALYDLDGVDEVLTYAKAFSLDPQIHFDVFDANSSIAKTVSERYGANALENISDETLSNYELIVISSPTDTHFDYLMKSLHCTPKLVICEKPVDENLNRLEKLRQIYELSKTRVMVNYFRNFQPGIIQLKQNISRWLRGDPCENITLFYQRGLHNNASHGISLLEFLFSEKIDFSNAIISNKTYDEFENDPTVTLHVDWNGRSLQIIGLKNARFSFFEINIFCQEGSIRLVNGCETVEWFKAHKSLNSAYSAAKLVDRHTGLISNRMKHVCDHAKRLLSDEGLKDNFLGSVDLSDRILKIGQKYE